MALDGLRKFHALVLQKLQEVKMINYEDEDKEMSEWESQGYVSEPCSNCGRTRVEKCANGKHWCEKCNWVIEDKTYFVPCWRI